MSNEIAIVEPLSGVEVVDAICHKVREMLVRDCFLSPNCAYERFSARVTVRLQAIDCGREVVVDQTVDAGQVVELPEVDLVESVVEIGEAPPNVVRRETEQPIPVLVEDGSGKSSVKRVKYQKKAEAPKE